jgi:hypothetical protein
MVRCHRLNPEPDRRCLGTLRIITQPSPARAAAKNPGHFFRSGSSPGVRNSSRSPSDAAVAPRKTSPAIGADVLPGWLKRHRKNLSVDVCTPCRHTPAHEQPVKSPRHAGTIAPLAARSRRADTHPPSPRRSNCESPVPATDPWLLSLPCNPYMHSTPRPPWQPDTPAPSANARPLAVPWRFGFGYIAHYIYRRSQITPKGVANPKLKPSHARFMKVSPRAGCSPRAPFPAVVERIGSCSR